MERKLLLFSKRSTCVTSYYCCISCFSLHFSSHPSFIMAKSVKSIESDKQHFRLCVHPCPCFITGGHSHGLYVAYLGAEHTRSALEGAVNVTVHIAFTSRCGFSAPVEHSLRKVLSPAFPAVRVSPLPWHAP